MSGLKVNQSRTAAEVRSGKASRHKVAAIAMMGFLDLVKIVKEFLRNPVFRTIPERASRHNPALSRSRAPSKRSGLTAQTDADLASNSSMIAESSSPQ